MSIIRVIRIIVGVPLMIAGVLLAAASLLVGCIVTQQQLAEPPILRSVLLLQGLPTSLGELVLGLGGMLLTGCGYAIIVGGDQA